MTISDAKGLSLQGLMKRYGSETVVADLDLDVPQGEFFTLLGPSGSGKTTTLSMIAGFAQPDGGRILLDGVDVTHAAPRERGLGMVFQNYAIFPHLDVFENVAFPLRVARRPREEVARRVADALALVKLVGFERRFSRQLSGGQQQRVALARAIVAAPRLVLMDEPLGALDKNLRYHMQVEIKDISRRLGSTVIYVTHDQEEALTMSDRIAIMNHGRIVQMGPPREVYERPDSVFVARFLGEANLVPASVSEGATLGPRGARLRTANVASDAEAGHVFVRPEKVTLTRPAPCGAANALPGVVRRATFLGNIIRTEVEVSEEVVVICDAANDAHAVALAPGDSVHVSWREADCRFLT